MATRHPGFHGLFGSRARPSQLSSQARLSLVDTAVLTPAVIEAQEQAGHEASRKLDHLFSGGSAGTKKRKEVKKRRPATDKYKKNKPALKKKKPALKKKKPALKKKKPALKKKKPVVKKKKPASHRR